MALELMLPCSGSDKHRLAHTKTKWVSALKWRRCTLLDRSISQYTCRKDKTGGRRRPEQLNLEQKTTHASSHCGADVGRQMWSPRRLMCVTDNCGCAVVKLVCDASLQLGDLRETNTCLIIFFLSLSIVGIWGVHGPVFHSVCAFLACALCMSVSSWVCV